MKRVFAACVAAATLVPALALSQPARTPPAAQPVKVVLPDRLPIATSGGSGEAAYWSSTTLDGTHPDIVRAVIMVHGEERNADVYRRIAEQAINDAGETTGTLLIVPQFLERQDAAKIHDPATLRWASGGWMDGMPAVNPAPLSSFSVIDAILEALDDRTRFPALRHVIVAGHSAGAQFIQRYAVVGHAADLLRQRAIDVTYAIANPSSFLYFDDVRPTPSGGFAPFDGQACPAFDRWKYGLHDVPPYVASVDARKLQSAYAARNVVYLAGADDTDPHQKALDVSCSAEAQGPSRYTRAHAYFRYVQLHLAGPFKQRIIDVPGVAHSARGIYTSAQARAIFEENE